MPPPPLINGLWTNFVDEEGHQSAGNWFTQDQSAQAEGPYSGLLTATAALTNMGLFGWSLQKRASLANVASSGPYNTYTDQAVFLVQSSNKTTELVIPGPVEEIFYGDGQFVDLGNALVQAWWAQVQATLGDALGSPWILLRSGYRRKVR